MARCCALALFLTAAFADHVTAKYNMQDETEGGNALLATPEQLQPLLYNPLYHKNPEELQSLLYSSLYHPRMQMAPLRISGEKRFSEDFSEGGENGIAEEKRKYGFVGMRGKKPQYGFVGMRGKKQDEQSANSAHSAAETRDKKSDQDRLLQLIQALSARYSKGYNYGYKRAPMGFIGMRGRREGAQEKRRQPLGFIGMRG